MKTRNLIVPFTLVALAAFGVRAETIHQTLPGDQARTSDGGAAIDKNLIEVKDEPNAQSGRISRVKGEVEQWGFVSYWFGIPTPAGKSVVRIRTYVDEAPAKFNLYVIPAGGGQELVGKITIPTDAEKDTFVDIDIPVDIAKEWSGVAVKKAEKTDKPGPWIDTISVVLPD